TSSVCRSSKPHRWRSWRREPSWRPSGCSPPSGCAATAKGPWNGSGAGLRGLAARPPAPLGGEIRAAAALETPTDDILQVTLDQRVGIHGTTLSDLLVLWLLHRTSACLSQNCPPFHVRSVHDQLSFLSLCTGLLRVGVTRDRRRLLPLAKAVIARSSSWAPLFGSDRAFRTRATALRGSTAACGGVGRQPLGKRPSGARALPCGRSPPSERCPKPMARSASQGEDHGLRAEPEAGGRVAPRKVGDAGRAMPEVVEEHREAADNLN